MTSASTAAVRRAGGRADCRGWIDRRVSTPTRPVITPAGDGLTAAKVVEARQDFAKIAVGLLPKLFVLFQFAGHQRLDARCQVGVRHVLDGVLSGHRATLPIAHATVRGAASAPRPAAGRGWEEDRDGPAELEET